MDRVSKKYRLAERLLIALVRNGQWQIDAEGRVWRTCVRSGLKGGGSHLIPVKHRRVAHRLPSGYLQVRATIAGVRINGLASRLVWQHVHGDIPPGHEVNHRNGIKDDDRPSNLTCGTPGENGSHARRTGLHDQFGQRNPAAKLSGNQVAQIRLAHSQGGWSQQRLAKRFGVSFQHISRIVRGRSRLKDGGPVDDRDHRPSGRVRDRTTGRYASPAGALLDGNMHRDFPR